MSEIDDHFKIGTRVVNARTGDKGHITAYLGDYSEYAVRYDKYAVEWEQAEDLEELLLHPELPLRKVAL